MFRINFPTKRIFRMFLILRTDEIALFCNYLWNDPRIFPYSDFALLNLTAGLDELIRGHTFRLSAESG